MTAHCAVRLSPLVAESVSLDSRSEGLQALRSRSLDLDVSSRLNADVRSKSTMRPGEDQYSMREPALERPQCHRNRPHPRLCVSGVRALLAPREHGAANPWFSCTHSLLTPAPWHNLQLHLDLGCRAGLPLHGPRPGCSGSRTHRDLRPCAFSASRWPASGRTWQPTCRSWGGSRR